jgi:sensor histidine kinase regulating citrate/malate metabolism
VINLMTNAIDASVAKGCGTIHIDLTPHADELLVSVIRSGNCTGRFAPLL